MYIYLGNDEEEVGSEELGELDDLSQALTCPGDLMSALDWSNSLLAGRTCDKLKPAIFGKNHSNASFADLNSLKSPHGLKRPEYGDPVRKEMADLLVGMNAEVFASVATAGSALDEQGHRLKISEEAIKQFFSNGTIVPMMWKQGMGVVSIFDASCRMVQKLFHYKDVPQLQLPAKNLQSWDALDAADLGSVMAIQVTLLSSMTQNTKRYEFRKLWVSAIRSAFGNDGAYIQSANWPDRDTPDLQKEKARLKWEKNQWFSVPPHPGADPNWAWQQTKKTSGAMFLKHTTFIVLSPTKFVMKYQTTQATCSTEIQWQLCVCPGCKCQASLSSMSVVNNMIKSTNSTFCDDWYQKVDQAVRVYVTALRGVILSRKMLCCAPAKKKKSQFADRVCRDEELKMEENDANQEEGGEVPEGWTDITDSALQQTSLRKDVQCRKHAIVVAPGLRGSSAPGRHLKHWKSPADQDFSRFVDLNLGNLVGCLDADVSTQAIEAFSPVMGRHYTQPWVKKADTATWQLSCGSHEEDIDVFANMDSHVIPFTQDFAQWSTRLLAGDKAKCKQPFQGALDTDGKSVEGSIFQYRMDGGQMYRSPANCTCNDPSGCVVKDKDKVEAGKPWPNHNHITFDGNYVKYRHKLGGKSTSCCLPPATLMTKWHSPEAGVDKPNQVPHGGEQYMGCFHQEVFHELCTCVHLNPAFCSLTSQSTARQSFRSKCSSALMPPNASMMTARYHHFCLSILS